MFRLLDRDTGFWFECLDDDMDYVWTNHKTKAFIFPDAKREFWEDDEDYEIIPLEVDELLAAMGAPRLPGLEED